ncbi:sulfotransferase [uncultured Jatrophihabitans sp.]|uniref:sulfotransferase n=1 Tax=uncultured Jatrophihabitans sp. TaxID=1610747 RepID=UPI0035CAF696
MTVIPAVASARSTTATQATRPQVGPAAPTCLPRAPMPIFVVGAPRSGTTLVASMIASHPLVAGAPESQFFNKLSPNYVPRSTTHIGPTLRCACSSRLRLLTSG